MSSHPASSTGLVRKYADLVVLPHSIFALPFALSAFWLAARGEPDQLPVSIDFWTLVLIIIAVFAARTAAMAFNRLIDADVDAQNPRTMSRALPRGELTRTQVWRLVLGSVVLFLAAAAALGAHCLMLAPLVLLVLLGYSFTKRFTSNAHIVLGLALALAPGGAWWVLRPEVSLTPIVLMLSVVFWVAGFDILYSCQDVAFDRTHALFSIPARVGVERALKVSLMFHILAVIGFFLVGRTAELTAAYAWGVAVLSIFLIGQHFLVTANDLSRVNRAFFTFNGVVSIGYFLLVLWVSSH